MGEQKPSRMKVMQEKREGAKHFCSPQERPQPSVLSSFCMLRLCFGSCYFVRVPALIIVANLYCCVIITCLTIDFLIL